jgi:hypothetical protein
VPTVAVAVAVHLAQAIARAGRSFGLPQGAMFETLLDAFEEELRTERLKLNIRPVPRGFTYRADLVWLEDSDNGSRSG